MTQNKNFDNIFSSFWAIKRIFEHEFFFSDSLFLLQMQRLVLFYQIVNMTNIPLALKLNGNEIGIELNSGKIANYT